MGSTAACTQPGGWEGGWVSAYITVTGADVGGFRCRPLQFKPTRSTRGETEKGCSADTTRCAPRVGWQLLKRLTSLVSGGVGLGLRVLKNPIDYRLSGVQKNVDFFSVFFFFFFFFSRRKDQYQCAKCVKVSDCN